MARTRKLTDDGDFEYVGGKQVVIEDIDAGIQSVEVCLRTIRGENVFHPTLGIDLDLMSIGGVEGRKAAIENALLRTGRVARVLSISEMSLPGKRRRYVFSIRALLKQSDGEVHLELSVG